MSRRFSPNFVSLIVLTLMACFVFGLCSAGSSVDKLRLEWRALRLSTGFVKVASSSREFLLVPVPTKLLMPPPYLLVGLIRPIAVSHCASL